MSDLPLTPPGRSRSNTLNPDPGNYNDNPILLQCLRGVKFLSTRRQPSETELKVQALKDLNKKTKQLLTNYPQLVGVLKNDFVILTLRETLIDEDKLIRQNVVKFFRLIIDEKVIKSYIKYKIHFLICRNMEKEYKGSDPKYPQNG